MVPAGVGRFDPPSARPAATSVGAAAVPPEAIDPPGVQATARRGLGAFTALFVVCLAVLAGAMYWLWRNPNIPPGLADQGTRLQTLEGRIGALADGQQDIQRRLDALEKRPVPQPVDLGPVQQRLDTLEKQVQSLPKPPDLGPVQGRLDDLQKQVQNLPKPPDLGPVEQRLTELGQQLGELRGRTDAAARDASGAGQAIQALQGQVADTHQQAEANAKALGALPGLTERATKLARIQAATAALEAGQKLGDIPGAPPALARFADQPPPTLAELRTAFPAAAQAAEGAGATPGQEVPLLDRMWDRVQSSVTIRRSGAVVVGDTTSRIVGQAQQALDAGDLAGTVNTLGALRGPAAQAMADWVAKAKALLDARAALAGMAANA